MIQHIIKSYLISTIIVILLPAYGYTQQLLSEFPVTSKITDVQTYATGDSIFMYIKDTGASYWIDRQGRSYPFAYSGHMDLPLIGITRLQSDYFFYYFNRGQNPQTISFTKYDAGGKYTSSEKQSFSFPGQILAAFVEDKDVFVISYEKKERSFKLTQLRNGALVKESAVKLAYDLSRLRSNEIQFIPDNAFLSIAECTARVKLYKQGDIVSIVVDDPVVSTDKNNTTLAKTVVYQWDTISGEVKNFLIGELCRDDFRSFLYDGRLYRTINNFSRFELKVQDLQGQMISSYVILKNDSLKKRNMIFREGKARRVSSIESILNMMRSSEMCIPSVMIEKDSKGQAVLTWGTYFDDNGMSAPAGVNPVAALSALVVGTIIRQSMEGPGISRYFYLSSLPGNRFAFPKSELDLLRVKIDSYEIEQQKKEIRFKYKAYTEWGSGLAGIYHDVQNKKLMLVKFDYNQLE